MAGREPGDSTERGGVPPRGRRRASAAASLPKAGVVASVGAAVLVVVGAVLASTVGLLFVSGIMGAGIGLVLAGARVPDEEGVAALDTRAATRIAVALALVAVVVAAAATWLVARAEGGVLGPIDYLLTTFGPFVPAELLIAGLSAAWGVRAGPVRS